MVVQSLNHDPGNGISAVIDLRRYNSSIIFANIACEIVSLGNFGI